MFSKYLKILVFVLIGMYTGFSQESQVGLSGKVNDGNTGDPLPFANVYIDKIGRGTVTDDDGSFEMDGLKPGEYHVTFSHVSCETKREFLSIEADTMIEVTLHHSVTKIETIVISSEKWQIATQKADVIRQKAIDETSGQNLAEMLETVPGVSLLSTGSGIGKPIVHGLYGNRLTILNNEIAQSGQQWGNDHSPEIDPMVANRISVIKGVGVVEYAGNSLGSLILVEPGAIPREPHLHGKANLFFETNGIGPGANVQLHQWSEKLAWKVNGTVKARGDRKTPDYFLRNTGMREANFAAQLEKSWSSKWESELYFSFFSTRLGILKGSHIGNLSDLEAAFEREEPFFTQDKFSYEIDAPQHGVRHYLWKGNTTYSINDRQWIELTYAGQVNDRREYDVRRSGRSETPALSLLQTSHFMDAKYQAWLSESMRIKTGLTGNLTDNTNDPETGILPLIPDYLSYEGGWFTSLFLERNKWIMEWGIRYDLLHERIAAISKTLPREIIRDNSTFQNMRSVGGVSYIGKGWELQGNLGYSTRQPGINERYSNGLHQGVSGIEEGDPDLQTEQSVKGTISASGEIKGRVYWESSIYYQHVNDYIYLQPQEEIRLTIRGAFPVFQYEQADARIYGLDLSAIFTPFPNAKINMQYSYLRGQNVAENIPLVNMPPMNASATLSYELPRWGKLENTEISINGQYVARQKHLLESQDYVLPPDAYFLTGAKLSTERQLKNTRLNIYFRVSNLLDVKYRDYLNRQRYYSDDLGRNMTLGATLHF